MNGFQVGQQMFSEINWPLAPSGHLISFLISRCIWLISAPDPRYWIAWMMPWCTDYGHPMRAVFLIHTIPNILADWEDQTNKLWGILEYFWWYTHALLSFPCSFLAVNHHNYENWVPSILTHNFWLEELKKNKTKWPTQKNNNKKKNWVFKIANSLYFFVKISWIGPCSTGSLG